MARRVTLKWMKCSFPLGLVIIRISFSKKWMTSCSMKSSSIRMWTRRSWRSITTSEAWIGIRPIVVIRRSLLPCRSRAEDKTWNWSKHKRSIQTTSTNSNFKYNSRNRTKSTAMPSKTAINKSANWPASEENCTAPNHNQTANNSSRR